MTYAALDCMGKRARLVVSRNQHEHFGCGGNGCNADGERGRGHLIYIAAEKPRIDNHRVAR